VEQDNTGSLMNNGNGLYFNITIYL